MIIPKDWSTMKKLMFLQQMGCSAMAKDTVSGNPVAFTTDFAKPLRRLALTLLPRQSGTGDPSPENDRPIIPWQGVTAIHTGENILDFDSMTERFVAYDGKIQNGDANNLLSDWIRIKPGESYVYSQECVVDPDLPSGKKTKWVGWCYYAEKDLDTVVGVRQTSSTDVSTFTAPNGANYIRIGGRHLKNGGKAWLTVGSTGKTYSPYTGQSYPVNLQKNLFDKANDVLGGYITSGGIFKSSSSGEKTISVYVKAGTYTLSKISTTRTLIAYFADTPVNNAQGTILSSVQTSPRTVTVSEDGYIVAFVYNNSGETNTWENVLNSIQLEEGQTATPYQPYIPPVYGGMIDLLTGVLTSPLYGSDFADKTWTMETVDGKNYFYSPSITGDYAKAKNFNFLCNKYKVRESYRTNLNDKEIGSYNLTNGMNRFAIRDDDAETVEEMLFGLFVVYELETPKTYQLTPQQINALAGDNTIWSDVDVVDVTYLKKR